MKSDKNTFGMNKEQIKLLEEYVKTGKYKGVKVTNLFTFSRQLGVSTSIMSMYFRHN